MAEASSNEVTVKSALCSDINVVQAGTPLEIRVSTTVKEESQQDEVGDNEHPVSATASGKDLGEAEVDITEESKGTYLVRLVPSTPDEYTLVVKHFDRQIPGSPFTVTAYDKSSFFEEGYGSAERASVMAGNRVSFILPVSGLGNDVLSASVSGSMGACESSINRDLHGIVAVRFHPTEPGTYKVNVQVNNKDMPETPFYIIAKGIEPDATKCYISEEDIHVFKKPLRFGDQPAKFHVSTANAGHDKLTIVAQGPGEATVNMYAYEGGIELCELTPSVPGKYHIDIMWSGTHIPGSPYRMKFRRPKTRIGGGGLNLSDESYCVGIPHKFKLNCSSLGEGALQLSCVPPTAAQVTYTPAFGDPRVFLCEIVPKEVGDHTILVMYKGKNVGESPFKVHFNPDITKCKMVEGSDEHDIGSSVHFLISTKEAGYGGELTATIINRSTESPIPATISKVSDDRYRVEFDPGDVMECLMDVRYDSLHIRGSPFNLRFSDPRQCKAEGPGILSAECNKNNRFTIATENAGPGVLRVAIENEAGVCVDPRISPVENAKYEVQYQPQAPGKHQIRVTWGKFDIPGSPFEVYCYELTQIQVKREQGDIHLREVITFSLECTPELASFHTNRRKSIGGLTVDAKSTRGAEVIGEVDLDSSGSFICNVKPAVAGKYNVNVRWNGTHVQGSPFKVKVVTPPMPENVKAHGPGLEDGLLAGQQGNFTVETKDAGTGLLAVRVHGPKGAFKIDTKRDTSQSRNILVNYNPTHAGIYRIEITWAGVNIPGSPFHVSVSNLVSASEKEVSASVTADDSGHPANESGNAATSGQQSEEVDGKEATGSGVKDTPTEEEELPEVGGVETAPTDREQADTADSQPYGDQSEQMTFDEG